MKLKQEKNSDDYGPVIIARIDASRQSDSDMPAIPEPSIHKCVSGGLVLSSNMHGKIIVPKIADFEHPENSHTYEG